jgi:hypothetical protein
MKTYTLLALLMVSMFLLHHTNELSYSANNAGEMTLEAKKDSCKTYIDLSKLIISLSTGVIILVPSFLALMTERQLKVKKALYCGLIALGISIVLGLFVIAALAGSQRIGEYNIAAMHIERFSQGQWILFMLGIILCGHFLLKNIFQSTEFEAFRGQLRKGLKRNREAFEGKYEAELSKLLGLSRTDIEAIASERAAFGIYFDLLSVVREASRSNINQTELKLQIEKLGSAAVEMAKRVSLL